MLKKSIAKTIARVSMSMAKKACGTASYYGTYQPKEPANLKKLCK
ncbi:MAG: cyclic lactone autoinducer peptide [Ruminiclostridium sp.]|nr:cyclic lactone autoinducer peptide [Ruminiclostridium sp.]